MVFSNESLNKSIRELVTMSNTSNPIQVIRAEQKKGPLPEGKPFATVRITLRPPLGWAQITRSNNISGEDIDELICERVECRASVNYYRNSIDNYADPAMISAIDEAVRLKTFLQGTLAHQKMNTDGLGLTKVSDVRNVSAVENAEWEERAQMDIDFNVSVTRTDLINEIKSILIQGEYQEHQNRYPVTLDIQEPV